MQVRVAVEDSLRPVKDGLRRRGFDVISLAGGVPDRVEAIVVNGLDDNLLGRQDILARVPVINASGLTPEEVAEQVSRRVHVHQGAMR